ncbi:MAG: hypothetical protein FJ026_10720 [Chloroflexi bacterium]|nr:hypothetical protein [Chloroflexota bacterium]
MVFFLRGVTDQSQDGMVRATKLQDLRQAWHTQLTQARISALALRLADALFSAPIITIPQAQRLLQVTYRSAQMNVQRLVQAGILQLAGEASYGRTCIATEIMNIIRDKDQPA